jgi:hypothetical protein
VAKVVIPHRRGRELPITATKSIPSYGFMFFDYLPFAQIDFVLSFFDCASPLVVLFLFTAHAFISFSLVAHLVSLLLKKVTHK